MRLLIDTAVFIFALEAPERFSKRAVAALENPESAVELSVVSVVEIAIKSARGKLRLPMTVVKEALDDLGARILPYTAAHAFELFSLPLHHRDPFDRQIIAQAMAEQIPVVTPDQDFRSYAGLEIIW